LQLVAGLSLLLVIVAAAPPAADAQRAFSLESNVRLLGSSRNNTRYLLTISPAADAVVPLAFRVDMPPEEAGKAELQLTPFDAEGAPPLIYTLMEPTADAGTEGRPLDVQLQPGTLYVDVRLQGVRPRTSYAATLTLVFRAKKHEWDLTLKVADRGALHVDKAPPLQLVTLAPLSWYTARQFPITLHDPSHRGPFERVRARVDEPNQVKTNTIASNFILDALSFWKDCQTAGGCVRIDNLDSPSATGLEVPKGGDLKLWARVESLSPGEYNPVLRFTADNASERADESRLALNLQVRHHWWLAVVVILLGSAAGLFGNKFVAGYWTARALRRETEDAEQSAAALARPDPRGSPWWLRSGANSYGLTRARLILRQAEFLSQSVFRVIAVEQEIRERVVDARRRLEALEALEATRLRLQLASIDRAVVQQRIGAGIRRALAIVDGAKLEAPQRAALDALLMDVQAWLVPDKQDALYRDAVLSRIRELLVTVTPYDVPGEKVRGRIAALLTQLEETQALSDLTTLTATKLVAYDHAAARLTLLWRDRLKGYADELARSEGNGDALEDLHRMANRELWGRLRAAAEGGRISVAVPAEAVKAYDLVEVSLALNASIQEVEVVNHPCVVRWRIGHADGTEREVLTYGLSLVQYFPLTGTMTFAARLEWDEDRIELKEHGTVRVAPNEDYRPWASFQSVELAVTGLAALFAIVTGLGYGYNATFGTSAQYIGLFLWAAGASAGGNLYKQRGNERTVGGQVAQLPGR
jgi:hypothetical protein